MAKRKATGEGDGKVEEIRKKAGPRSGLVRVTLYVRPEQLAALQELSKERAEAKGALYPDVSEAARFAFDAWLAKRK